MSVADGGTTDEVGEDPRSVPDLAGRGDPTSASARAKRSWLLVVHLLLAGGAVAALSSGLNPQPDTSSRPKACVLVRDDDSLLQLTKRWPEERVIDQLERTTECDQGALSEMRAAVRRDYALVVVIGVAFAVAVLNVRRRRRWRLAAVVGAVLGATYVAADLTENHYLRALFDSFEDHGDGAHVAAQLRWFAAVKLGALIGGVPVLMASLAMSLDHLWYGITSDVDTGGSSWTRIKRFVGRWIGRVTRRGTKLALGEETRHAYVTDDEHVEPDRAVGVCASGGGVRSAAFNLGAFQALGDETEKIRWITAVSGGSYFAAAWAAAPGEWGRGSAREDHLRRNASYLAPGLGGKLWALTRFLFGFALNLGLVALSIGVAFIPYGWWIDAHQAPKPLDGAGTIRLPKGGCLERPDGTFALAEAGESLTVASGSRVRVDRSVAPEIPGRDAPAKPQVAVVVDGNDVDVEVRTAPTTPTTPTPPTTAPPALTASCERDQQGGAAGPDNRVVDAPRSQLLRKGWRMKLDLRRPIAVAPAQIAGCSGPTPPCARTAMIDVPDGSRLVAAPDAELVLAKDAVADDGQLAARCGRDACPRWEGHGGLTTALAVSAGLALLAGLAIVLTRLEAAVAMTAERATRLLVVVTLALGAAVQIVPAVVSWAERHRHTLEADLVPTAGAGTAGILVALVSQLSSFAASKNVAGAGPGKLASVVKSAGQRLRPLLVRLAAYLAGPVLVAAVILLFALDASAASLRPSQLTLWVSLVSIVAITLAVGDLNEWSLHPFYRDRLKTAFAAHPTTLECPPDRLSDLREPPELIVCAAANIADARLTAPGRPVTSWTFSKREVGARAFEAIDGATPTFAPDRLPASLAHLDSLWTAVAVSGAAFSPAMGKMTRAERMLLALGNLRLGQWYPNPRYVTRNDGEVGYDIEWYNRHYPRPWYLAKEALGLHRAGDPWVYVTDGGHYENLGLVELIRRRCKEIYCFDAAGDAPDTFGTIADAMRLAREELDVEIDIDPTRLKPSQGGESDRGTWLATVRYPDNTSGWIVVAKLSVPKSAPFDLKDSARTLPAFPTHPTADQLYTDQKFEAYRALGHHLGSEALDLATRVRARMAGPPQLDAAAAVAAVIDELEPATAPPDRVDVRLL